MSLPTLVSFFQVCWTSMLGGKRVLLIGMLKSSVEDLAFLGKLVAAGEMKPVIDRSYPLEEMVEAHRYVGTGRRKRSVSKSVQ